MIVLGFGITIIIALAFYVKVLDAQYFALKEKKGEPPEKDKPCMCQ
jgi:hypothetical protein